jgi:hypothetical protein
MEGYGQGLRLYPQGQHGERDQSGGKKVEKVVMCAIDALEYKNRLDQLNQSAV